MPRNEKNSRWWPVLYVEKAAKTDEEGSFVWKLRDELTKAFKKIDLTNIKLYANMTPRFWKISLGTDFISEAELASFDNRKVIVVHKDSPAKGKSKVS